MQGFKKIDWPAWIGTLALIISFREVSVWLCRQWGHPELGNLTGLLSLLIILVIWRKSKGLPQRLIDTNGKMMRESGFAFLPLCAGSLIALVHMGTEIPLFLLVMTVSTLLPLWVYAKMAKKWL